VYENLIFHVSGSARPSKALLFLNGHYDFTSLLPSTDQKGGKPAKTYNGREKTSRKAGGQKGHRGTTLTREDVEEKIRSGNYHHEIRIIGDPVGNVYST